MIQKYVVFALTLPLLGVSLSAAPAKTPTITLVYTTAETTDSAAVVWNTNIASDSRVQYSTSNPIPVNAPQFYRPEQVSYHEFQLEGLTPGTLYYYRVTSCTRRGCTSATGTFETYPTCPDVVPPVSGSWQRVTSPNTGATADNELLAVDAISENDAWAVGWARDPNGPQYVKQTFTQHFDGTSWSIVPSPTPAGDEITILYGVSGTSANNVWAVGSTHNNMPPARTLIEHWDGRQWSITPSPSPDTQLNELRAVTALSATDAWAVGWRGGTRNETPLETLIVHWDGTSWSQVPSPNIDGGANELFGITAISANDIWAVGFAGGAPLAMHWDGSTWSVFPIRGSSGSSSEWFTAVSGTASNDVWAVGQSRGFYTPRASASIWHWDGARWTEKLCYAHSASNPPADYEGGGPDAYLTGVSAVASNDVWLVGVSGSGPTILHWDGRALTWVTHPRAFPHTEALRAVATTMGGRAWGVGTHYDVDYSTYTTTERTLIHRYIP